MSGWSSRTLIATGTPSALHPGLSPGVRGNPGRGEGDTAFGVRRSALVLLLAFLFCAASTGAYAADSVTVPFTMHGMHIFVQCTVNNVPVTLVLDSGAGANVITPQGAKKLDLKATGPSGTVVGAGGAESTARMATLNTLAVGDARLEKQTAVIIPLPDALPCDGLLGTPFFDQWVVTIDYAASKLTLTLKGHFTPPPDAVALTTQIVSNTVHVSASVDGIKGLFKLDTGAGDCLTLFRQFVDKNNLRRKYTPAIKMVTGRGVGGLIYGEVVRLPKFSMGPFDFKGVSADLSLQTQGAFADSRLAGNIGEALLERFTVTFDHSSHKMYLSKNATFNDPFIGNRSGLATDYVKGVISVLSVISPSPASESGIHEGDTIVAINDRTSDQLMPWEPRDLLYGDVGSVVRLKVRSGGEAARDVTLTLRELY